MTLDGQGNDINGQAEIYMFLKENHDSFKGMEMMFYYKLF